MRQYNWLFNTNCKGWYRTKPNVSLRQGMPADQNLKHYSRHTRQKKKSQIWSIFSFAFGLRGYLQPKKKKQTNKQKKQKQKAKINTQGRFFQEAFWVGVALAVSRSNPYQTLLFWQQPFLSSVYSPSHLNMSSRG